MADFPESLLDMTVAAVDFNPTDEEYDNLRVVAVTILRALADHIEQTAIAGPGTLRGWANEMEAKTGE